MIISDSIIENATVTTKSPAALNNITIRGQLTMSRSKQIQIINSYVKSQVIKTGGSYKYV